MVKCITKKLDPLIQNLAQRFLVLAERYIVDLYPFYTYGTRLLAFIKKLARYHIQ